MKDDQLYLLHIRECLDRVARSWDIVERDLPPLRQTIEALLR